MPETYCPYENKRQRKRRRGIAQLSLSSLKGDRIFHVNHNHQKNQIRRASVDNKNETQATIISTSAFDCAGETITEDGHILDDLTTVTDTASSASNVALKSTRQKLAPSRNILLRRRRKKTVEKDECSKDGMQQTEDKDAEDHDHSKNNDCNQTESSSFSVFPTQSNSKVIDANSNESRLKKMAIDNMATNEVDNGINDHGIGRNPEVDMLEMKEVCSIGYFRATPLDEFRRRCTDCLKHNVLLSSSTSNYSNHNKNGESRELIRYDRLDIIRRLTDDIDWKSLCEHHDKREYKRQRHITNKSSKTALCEIILAVTNPMVIPRCCHSQCLIDVLLNALLISPSLYLSLQQGRKINDKNYVPTATNMASRWTPSQRLLLETIRSLLLSEWMQANSSVWEYAQNFVLLSPFFLTAVERGTTGTCKMNPNTITPNKVNRLLSAIYWLLSSSISLSSFPLCVERELVSAGLLLLQRIDGWNIQIDLKSKEQPIREADDLSHYSCATDNRDIRDSQHEYGFRRPINRKMTVGTLSNLHDESIEIGINPTQNLHRNNNLLWRRYYGNDQKQVSLKDVLAMKQNKKTDKRDVASAKNFSCNKNSNIRHVKRKQVGASETTVISRDWSTIRSRAYKKFVSYAVGRRQQQHLRQSSSNYIVGPMIVRNSDESFLWRLVNEAAIHQESPSLRVCLALVAHSFGGPKNPCYFKHVARLFWEGFLISSQQQKSSSSQWLRLYSEWLSECAVFDQPEIAWEAIQPILQYISACLVPNEQEQEQRGLSVTGNTSTSRDSMLNSKVSTTSEIYGHDDKHDVEPAVMACLAYILHRRSHLFKYRAEDEKDTRSHRNGSISKSRIETDFERFMNLLSIHCGESPEQWLGLFSDSTRDLVESSLQRLRVLSFSVSDLRMECNNNVATEGLRSLFATNSDVSMYSIATSDWPFCEELSLRKAMERIDRTVLPLENGSDAVKSLLSNPVMVCRTLNQKTKIGRRSKEPMPSIPMNNFIHDSGILCLIFSFCGPKRLNKIPQVCKTWKVVSDAFSNTLWESAYVSDFGKYRWACVDEERQHRVATEGIFAVDSKIAYNKTENVSKTYWKNLFTQKQIVENMVRFHRNPRSGYKHRTCNYVGCLAILKTAEQERKHNQMHLRLLEKQKAALKKKKALVKSKGNNINKGGVQKKKGGQSQSVATQSSENNNKM